ncbi:MAG: TonB family protein, partial [Desulfuromonadales bacterium]|nr:TonB family protein [Desulfuromonadales bacterium]
MLPQKSNEIQLNLQKPTIITLVDRPKKVPQRPHDFEIDQRPTTPKPKTPVDSFRKAERDQKVEREQAPKGDDVRDQSAKAKIHTPSQQRPPQQRPALQQPEHQLPQPTAAKPYKKGKQSPTPASPTQPLQPQPLPAQLQPDPNVLERIANGNRANRNRNKDRTDVEIGDEVWLNLESNLLASFFRRFHNQIELVWNYPTEAVMNGVEGTLELLIIVDKKGELLDVYPEQSSGSNILDFEAIQAVYRAAPFGALTKHYPHD